MYSGELKLFEDWFDSHVRSLHTFANNFWVFEVHTLKEAPINAASISFPPKLSSNTTEFMTKQRTTTKIINIVVWITTKAPRISKFSFFLGGNKLFSSF